MSMVEAHARGEHQFAAMPGCPTCSNAELQRVRREKDDLDALREAQEGHVKMTVYANQLEHQAREQAKEIERLKKERDGAVKQALEQHRIVQDQGWELRAERAHRERLEKLLLDIADDATDGPINCGLNSVQAVLEWREALRPAAPEPTPSEKCPYCGLTTCRYGADPTSTCHAKGDSCRCSVQPDHERSQRNVERMIQAEERVLEQPDLPLGHEFVAGHPHPAYQSYCALRGIFGLCGQPESAHRRK